MTPARAGALVAAPMGEPAVESDEDVVARRIALVAGALASPVRVRILDVLRRGATEVCQCELSALSGIEQSLLSHHMRRLAAAGLVRVERRHRWAWYSVPDDAFAEVEAWLA